LSQLVTSRIFRIWTQWLGTHALAGGVVMSSLSLVEAAYPSLGSLVGFAGIGVIAFLQQLMMTRLVRTARWWAAASCVGGFLGTVIGEMSLVGSVLVGLVLAALISGMVLGFTQIATILPTGRQASGWIFGSGFGILGIAAAIVFFSEFGAFQTIDHSYFESMLVGTGFGGVYGTTTGLSFCWLVVHKDATVPVIN